MPVTYTASTELPVTYTVAADLNCYHHAVLFSTSDGGKTWKPDRMLSSSPVRSGRRCYPATVISVVEGSTWVLANQSLQTPPSLTTLSTGASVDISQPSPDQLNDSTITDVFYQAGDQRLQLDFVTPSMGWMMWRGQLLTTTSGGLTWNQITLGPPNSHRRTRHNDNRRRPCSAASYSDDRAPLRPAPVSFWFPLQKGGGLGERSRDSSFCSTFSFSLS